ncbi:MAG: amino acid ABC transporter substrate-binding protein [Clostridia bacterium]|nr:ABC transporter substrate-binding protein [Lachnospiraceae bacterium]NCC00425.1 amino acid ABC transporter substrate-binding protein [Clostridia bacterium]NCD02624.1 amino acid ABC transporter substrate-binding protein [Clostridia bacterium]
MKKILSLACVCALAVSMMAGCGSKKEETTAAATTAETTEAAGETTAKDSGKLIMATEAGFAPYEYTEDGQTVVGVDVDIANEIAKAMGKELEVQNMTFDGALLAVQQGVVDFAAAGISVTPERQEQMDFSIEYATSKQVVVVKKDAGKITKPEDVTEGTVVGVQMGTTGDFYCTDDLKCEVKQFNKYAEAAMELKNDKIECIVMDSLPAEQLVAANEDLEILEGELFTDKYAIAVKKGNEELLNEINQVLQTLVDEGKVDEFTIKHTAE